MRLHSTIFRAPNKTSFGLPVGFLFLGVLSHVCLILWLNNGHLVYRLDDPYIHLALADNIGKGHYGLNPGERSAPSSSILWPFLLSPFAGHAFGEYLPFLISIVASVASIALVTSILGDLFPAEDRRTRWVIPWIVILFQLLTNTIGLIFTGMEASLQVFCSLALVAGLLRLRESSAAPSWLGIVIVLGPLVRYENLALSVPALFCLALTKHYRLLAISLATMAATLVGFSCFLHALGLGWLPSSVVAKSCFAEPGLGCVARNAMRNVFQGWLLVLVIVGLTYRIVLPTQNHHRWIAGMMVLSIVLFLIFGHYGGRYDTFIWASTLLVMVEIYRVDVVRFALRARVPVILFLSLLLLLVGAKYVKPTLGSFLGSNNIYQQQYQMYRFVRDFYKAPVAVNDIGRVSYRNNGIYVLDLFGLASREALSYRRAKRGAQWMNDITSTHGVQFAMIYDDWFRNLPENWTPVAKMHLGRPRVSAWGEVVTFYALNPETARRLQPLLVDFRGTLPKGVRFEILPTS